jgi:hypothetical protein
LPTSDETARKGLVQIARVAVADTLQMVAGAPDPRPILTQVVPYVIDYYAVGAAALATDYYDDLREAANPRRPHRARPVVNPRDEKVRRALMWAAEPSYLPTPDPLLTAKRIDEVVQAEVARPFRDTITENQRSDRAGLGWKRHVRGDTCRFCRFLAGQDVLYRKERTARFASHPHCDCVAVPVFEGGEFGKEADALQYAASKRRRSPAEKAQLRRALDAMAGPEKVQNPTGRTLPVVP